MACAVDYGEMDDQMGMVDENGNYIDMGDGQMMDDGYG